MLLVGILSSLLLLLYVSGENRIFIPGKTALGAFEKLLKTLIDVKHSVNIYYSFNATFDTFGNDLLEHLVKKLHGTFVFDTFSESNLIIIDSANDLEKTLSCWRDCGKKCPQVVVWVKAPNYEVDKVLQRYQSESLSKVFLREGNDFTLVTNHSSLDRAESLVIAKNSGYLCEKSSSSLNIGIIHDPPAVICSSSICDFPTMSGRDVEIVKTLSENLNLKVQIKVFEREEFDESLQYLKEKRLDFLIGELYLREERSEFADFSLAYYSASLVFTVPQGRPLTYAEKLLKPFQTSVWILTLLTIAVVSLFAVVISHRGKKLKAFVLGD